MKFPHARLLRLAAPLLSLLLVSRLSAAEAPTTTGSGPVTTPVAPTDKVVEQFLSPPEPGRFRDLFQRFRTEHATLAPDGKHLAYSVREHGAVWVVVIDVTQPQTMKACVKVAGDAGATLALAPNQREDTPGQIFWLRWATANRVVVGTNEQFLQGNGAILAFDAAGANARKLADPRDLLPPTKVSGPFATSRARRNEPLTPTPDMDPEQAAREQAAREAAGGLDPSLPPAEEDDIVNETINPAELQPRSLRVYDFDAKRPGAVTVIARSDRGSDTHWLDFYSLETGTGKLSGPTSSIVSDFEAALPDRQGLVRLSLPDAIFRDFPFRYAYLGLRGKDRPKPLDEIPGVAGFSVSPANYFGERSIPLGFAEDPNVLYYASNLGRDTHGIYSLNLATGQRGALTMESPRYDLVDAPKNAFPGTESLIYDRHTHALAGVRYQAARRTTTWLRPELQAVQAEMEQTFPGLSVELVEWDETARRFLVATDGPADPGGYYFYDRESHKLTEFVRRAPWVEANHIYQTLPFDFTLTDGTRLSGFVTLPRQPRMKPTPLILLCPDTPWARADSGYNRDVHALAGMGFVVAQLNGRGAWGTGRRQREAITAGYDLVQVQDVVSAVDALSQRFQINPKRIALMGRGHGAFIALRTLQDHPTRFRCAIALEPPVNLATWLDGLKWTEETNVLPHLTRAWLGDEARLKAAPLATHPEAITQPVQILSYPGPEGVGRRLSYLSARRFAESVSRHGTVADLVDLPMDYVSGLPAARARVFDSIEEFLNLHIYDFKVKLNDLQIIP